MGGRGPGRRASDEFAALDGLHVEVALPSKDTTRVSSPLQRPPHARKRAQALTSFRSPRSSCTIVCWNTSTFGCVRIFRQSSSCPTGKWARGEGEGEGRTTGTWDCGGPVARKPLPDENSKEGYCALGPFLLRLCARALSEPRNEFEYTVCVRACMRRQGPGEMRQRGERQIRNSQGARLAWISTRPRKVRLCFWVANCTVGELSGRRSVCPSVETYQDHTEYRRGATRRHSASVPLHVQRARSCGNHLRTQ